MLQKIKHTIITLGIASGMTAVALFYLTGVDQCRAVVLQDMKKSEQFKQQLAGQTEVTDFLTALTRGK